MKKKLTHNLFLKILSVLFAFMLWIIVVIVNDPYKTVIVSGVPITIINEDELTGQGIGQIYSLVSPQSRTVSIKVYGQRSKVDNLKAEDIQAVVDFSEVSSVGAVHINVSEPEGVTILGKTPEMMKLDVEALQERTFELEADITGDVAEGYMINSVITNPKSITVIGPESVMQKLSRAEVKADVSGSTDDVTETSKIVLYDAAGKTVDYFKDANMKLSDKTAVVMVETLMTKEVAIEVETAGKVGENYRLTGMTQNRNTAVIKGHADVLSTIDKIVISEESKLVDLSNLAGSKEILIDISEFLPDGVAFVNEDDRFVTIGINIESVIEQSFRIMFDSITLLNLSDDLKVIKEDTDAYVEVLLRGFESDISNVSIDTLKPYVNMTNCGPGEHYCKLVLNLPADVKVVRLPQIDISLQLSGK